MPLQPPLQFVPSRVEGVADVSEVVVFPDRLELRSANESKVFRFADIARWPRPAWLWRSLFHLGLKRRGLMVADRDWFHLPRDRFFAFYTTPPVVVRMPVDEPREHGTSYFLRVQQVLHSGGFSTFDLG